MARELIISLTQGLVLMGVRDLFMFLFTLLQICIAIIIMLIYITASVYAGLTSAWNWCSKIEKKKYYNVFKLCGFVGFDGDFRG